MCYFTLIIYLEKFVHMVAYECATLVSLPLNIQLLQAIFQAVVEGAITWSEFLVHLLIQLTDFGGLSRCIVSILCFIMQ